MTEQWPPPGAAFVYRFDHDFEHLSYSAEVTVISRPHNADLDAATFRYGRLGGDTAADLSFRASLYERIGAVTVAGGHAEAAMKRVILSAEGKGQQFEHVDLNWTGLVKRLRRVVDSGHALSEPLSVILDWAERVNVKGRRDDVVHAYWWHWTGVGVTRSRFTRDGRSYTITGPLEDLRQLDRDSALIFEYARRLDDLVVSTRPQARLVAPPSAFARWHPAES
ncbi:hypothetical protein [Georgenia sp. H159]|uniref:hypothetical protein n=1 Tax=Georgenia sp. H159 TaxID=3076115 RepID=UPI002D789DD9|nr:hypothetical protein [Georgenia sp. H159]